MKIESTPEGRLAIIAVLSAHAMNTMKRQGDPSAVYELLEIINLVSYRSESFLRANEAQIQEMVDSTAVGS